MGIHPPDRLLAPRSVAVVGASSWPGSVGATVWRNLHAGKCGGQGLKAAASHTGVPAGPDRVFDAAICRAGTLAHQGRPGATKQLAGNCDRPPPPVHKICDARVAVSQRLADLPEPAELDVRPLLADANGVIVGPDAHLRVAAETGPGGAGTARFAIQNCAAELAETWPSQGRPLLVRPMRREHEARHLACAMPLARDDIRMRSFHTRRTLPRSDRAGLARIDCDRQTALGALATQPDGSRHTLGVVRAVADPRQQGGRVRHHLGGQRPRAGPWPARA
ncbi:MAG: hypothetical protein V4739_14265 [Pseudomonadota bacterium]